MYVYVHIGSTYIPHACPAPMLHHAHMIPIWNSRVGKAFEEGLLPEPVSNADARGTHHVFLHFDEVLGVPWGMERDGEQKILVSEKGKVVWRELSFSICR